MSNKLHVIYVPGVGDSNPVFQRRVVRTWKLWGVDPELHQINWAQEASWSKKHAGLLVRIDELISQNKQVALVGVSAGGAAVMAAYTDRQENIVAVVLICGKLKNPGDIGPKYRNANPALVDAITDSDAALKKLKHLDVSNILTRRALFDEVVTTHEDSIVDGAHNSVSPTIGHAITIGLQLVFGAPSFLRFLKKHNR